jgi:hypothetical protein
MGQNDKENLKAYAKSKLTTTMIYPLSQFEDEFGYLWGIDKEHYELTEDELKFKEAWSIVRQNILDVGNRELRLLNHEIGKYDINYRGAGGMIVRFSTPEQDNKGNI